MPPVEEMILQSTGHLGPARVLGVRGPRLRLLLEERGEEVEALLALAFPYAPLEGDRVLAIGQEGRYYAIGLIEGRGKTSFTAPGDLELRAPRGRIELVSPRGIALRGGDVELHAGSLRLAAQRLHESFGKVWRRVRQCIQLRAGRVRQVVEEGYSLRAERIVERARKDVKIDGQRIDLG